MGMIATFPIKSGAGARMRMAPTEKAAFPYAKGSILPKCPSSEVVCLVDDDPLVLRSTGLLLASEGFVVRQFDKGKDFIAYVASHDVPLVVLDIWMEEMNGLEVLARLSAMSPQTHVIVITGREDIVARVTATRLGAGAFLIKPFDAEQFLEAVHDALGPPAHFEQSVVAPAEASSTARFSRKCSVSERAMLAA